MRASMRKFNYGAAAELFPGRNPRAGKRALKYIRFERAAEAIRFAMERLPADVLLGTCMEVNENRYDSTEIRLLYEHAEYPFQSPSKAA
jgi:hypothetical protein